MEVNARYRTMHHHLSQMILKSSHPKIPGVLKTPKVEVKAHNLISTQREHRPRSKNPCHQPTEETLTKDRFHDAGYKV